MQLCQRSATDVVSLLKRREVSALEVLDAAVARIETVDARVNALPIRDFDRARETARAMDGRAAADQTAGVLHGLPVVIKDQFDVAGLPTTQGFPPFAGNIAAGDDVVVETLKASGANIHAKSNVPELGFGGYTDNGLFGPTRNPWDLSRTPGGSSGGSAAAVAARTAWLAMGSDLGGSLRIPAAFCGVVGLRPTPGTVAYGPRSLPFDRLSVCGPLARTVADAALLLDAMAAAHPADPISRPPFPPGGALQAAHRRPSLSTLRVNWSPDLGGLCKPETGVLETCEAALRALGTSGLQVQAEPFPCRDATAAARVLRGVRLATLGRTLQNHHDALPAHLRGEITEAGRWTVDDVAEAEERRAALWYRFAAVMAGCDLLACPAAITTAFPGDRPYPQHVAGVAFHNYSDWFLLTQVLSLLGAPVAVLPCGLTDGGLPVGLQLVGWPNRDLDLISAAAAIEEALGFPGAAGPEP